MKVSFYLLFVVVFHLSKHNYAQYQDALANYLIDDSDISVANYNLLKTVNNQSFTVYTLNVTSLKWFNATFSSSPIWWHTVYVTVPKNINSTQSSFFFMNSGTNAPYSEGKYQSLLSTLSVSCQCVTVNMHQVPNQPIVFYNDPSQKSKTEDEIVAYTFNEWVKNRQNYPGNSSNSLPLLFPMVKSVKRSMDLVLQFLTSVNTATNGKFIVSGVSKRGWTSLLTTAVDSRVIANIPVVYDNININPCTHAHYQNFGGAYSFALQDYYLQNLTLNVDEISYYYLGQLIDPYAYFTKYQNKQFMFVTSSLDEFMMPWNTQYFWRDLNIQTNNKAFLRRLPNTDHYLPGQDQQLAATFSNFIKLQSLNTPNKWPLVQWDFSNNVTHGVIDVTISNLALFNSFQVTGIYAYSNSTKRKDFRMYTLSPTGLALQPIKWQNKVVAIQTNATSLSSSTGSLKYKYAIQRDATFTRYTAFYVQIAFNMNSSPLTSQVSESQLFTVTTETNIIPEFNPVGDCHGSDCLGYLV